MGGVPLRGDGLRAPQEPAGSVGERPRRWGCDRRPRPRCAKEHARRPADAGVGPEPADEDTPAPVLARDEALLVLATECHPRTLRQMRWTNTMIKNIAPQILAVGVSPAR
ncbi:hypothetical protein DEJ48_28080 [Streptomyces venezuelae]|uniref:Uncharacterized protein n=1 Tax=Streptomyces venezuelae TaxID=54571 RepID=A0A5P2C2I2_STRVZ|nr:hypothetical protein DEJ48_28080 [Streptomyces venezuelae]